MTEMQSVQSEPSSSPPAPERPSTLVDKMFDIGTAWAAAGLGFGKTALEQSARTLEKGAKKLETLSSNLTKTHESK